MMLLQCDQVIQEPDSLELFEILGNDLPPYAILSHTWLPNNQEITFQDLADLSRARRRKEQGWRKILQTCKLALLENIQYAWVDTCCIDKSSSSVLTEAINSMFSWYARSTRCFAHMEDYVAETHGRPRQAGEKELHDCRWFKRGWTLQEIIAPSDVAFYDSKWEFFGHRSGLVEEIAFITGIDTRILSASRSENEIEQWLGEIPASRKMSWAATRETTRVEDMAYCLLGIFDVNMPLLYGEGHKAFIRLQEEIIKHSTDLSLLAWVEDESLSYSQQHSPRCYEAPENIHGILACSPRLFSQAADLVPASTYTAKDHSVINKGLKMNVYLYSMGSSYRDRHNLFAMNINIEAKSTGRSHGIYLTFLGADMYARTLLNDFWINTLSQEDKKFEAAHMSDIYSPVVVTPSIARSLSTIHRFAFRLILNHNLGFEPQTSYIPRRLHDAPCNLMITQGSAYPIVCYRMVFGDRVELFVYAGCITGADPWVSLDGKEFRHERYPEAEIITEDFLRRKRYWADQYRFQDIEIIGSKKKYQVTARVESSVDDSETVWLIHLNVFGAALENTGDTRSRRS